MLTALRAPLPEVDVERAVAGVLLRIEREPPARAQSHRRRWMRAALLAATLAAAAGIAFALSRAPAPAARDDEGAFASRGGGSLSLRQAASATFQREGTTFHRLEPGETIAKDTKLTVSYRNVREREAVYLLAFAVDGDHVVHWIFPAYERAGEDPPSVSLPPSAGESLLSTSVILEDPKSGLVRFVSIVSSAPHHLSEVESLPAAELGPSALRARFHADLVDETVVSFP